MKSINARTILKLAFCFCLFLIIGVPKSGLAAEYYTYHDPDGKLVISNQPPPPGSKIIKKQDLAEPTDIQTQKGQEPIDTKIKGNIEGLTKPSK